MRIKTEEVPPTKKRARPLPKTNIRPTEPESAALYQAAFEQAAVGIAHVDLEGRWLRVNRRLCEILGCSQADLIGRSYREFTLPEEVPIDDEALLRLASGETDSHTREKRYIRCNGTLIWVNRTISIVRDPDGRPRHCISIIEDITERKRAQEALRESEERSRALLSAIPERVFFKDSECIFIQVNELFASDIGKRPEEVIGRSDFDLFPAELAAAFQSDDRRVMQSRMTLVKEERNHLGGRERVVEVTKSPVIDDHGQIIGVLGLFSDITERKKIEDQIRRYSAELEKRKADLESVNTQLENLATTDGLTGLMNHRVFHERLREEFSRASRYGTPLSIIMLDVDWFKQYNDAFGHLEGDAVLREIGAILRMTVRSHDIPARYGGEEFAVILPMADGRKAKVAAGRVRRAIERAPWRSKPVTVSVGIATLQAGTPAPHKLLQQADAALYHSKAAGRNCVTHFDEAETHTTA